jgi:hypothetical protein
MLTLPTDFALLGGKGNRINPRWRPNLKTKGLDRRGLRHIANVGELPDPPSFSLPTTFHKIKLIKYKFLTIR